MAGQVFSQPSAGGLLYGNQLSDVIRLQVQPLTKFKQFCDGRAAGGKGKGQTFTWDIIGNFQTPGGALVETQTMPQTNFVVAQGTLTVSEYGNAVPWSGFLEDLSKFDIKSPAGRMARMDAALTLDRAAWAQFNSTPLRAIASSGTDTGSITLYTNGTVTGTNNVAFTTVHAGSLSDLMKGRNIPAYNGNDYFALSNVSTLRNLKSGNVGGTNLQTINQYTETGRALIRNGEIGRYESIRFVEQTNIAPGIGLSGIAQGLPGPNGTVGDMVPWAGTGAGNKSDWMFIFGEDTVIEAIVEIAHLRSQIPGDFGRSKGLAWYYVGGFGLSQGFSSTAGSPGGQTNARVVKWDSQA